MQYRLLKSVLLWPLIYNCFLIFTGTSRFSLNNICSCSVVFVCHRWFQWLPLNWSHIRSKIADSYLWIRKRSKCSNWLLKLKSQFAWLAVLQIINYISRIYAYLVSRISRKHKTVYKRNKRVLRRMLAGLN